MFLKMARYRRPPQSRLSPDGATTGAQDTADSDRHLRRRRWLVTVVLLVSLVGTVALQLVIRLHHRFSLTQQQIEELAVTKPEVRTNREYLAPQIRSMNNRFHSEAKLPWSYDYPLANHLATNKSSANREMPLFSRLTLLSGIFENFPAKGFKILPIGHRKLLQSKLLSNRRYIWRKLANCYCLNLPILLPKISLPNLAVG